MNVKRQIKSEDGSRNGRQGNTSKMWQGGGGNGNGSGQSKFVNFVRSFHVIFFFHFLFNVKIFIKTIELLLCKLMNFNWWFCLALLFANEWNAFIVGSNRHDDELQNTRKACAYIHICTELVVQINLNQMRDTHEKNNTKRILSCEWFNSFLSLIDLFFVFFSASFSLFSSFDWWSFSMLFLLFVAHQQYHSIETYEWQ